MNPYLAKLRNLKNRHLEAPTKPTKPSSVSFVGSPGRRFLEKSGADDPLTSGLWTLEHCPACVPETRWRQAIEDGQAFLAEWGLQALALGWTGRDLFGLHEPPANPHPSYSRLSRVDQAGLCWLLLGGEVTAISSTTAVIRTASGATLKYRRCSESN
jgi:hypothetical protein